MTKYFQDPKTKTVYPYNAENEQKWLKGEKWSLVYDYNQHSK